MNNTTYQSVRAEFPLLSSQPNLIYLDNAASTQKPKTVLSAMDEFYKTEYANVHRGIYNLSEQATKRYEMARETVAKFLNVSTQEIIFTKNATESINLVAYSWGNTNIKEGDEILISILEHHSNFLPWQILCKQKNAKLVIAPVRKDGTLDEEKTLTLISSRTKLIALTMLSNVTGELTPLERIIAFGKQQGTKILLDGVQAMIHHPINLRALGADFLVFSGHKMFGPTGIGVLVGKKEVLKNMDPFLLGGDMVKSVSVTHTEWNDLPWKFEAGTPPITEAIGLATAIEYLQALGSDYIQKFEQSLTQYALEAFKNLSGVKLIGSNQNHLNRAPIFSFEVNGIHPHDLASILNEKNIAIRSGYFCAEPLVRSFGCTALARASFTVYNTISDIDALMEGIKSAQKIFRL